MKVEAKFSCRKHCHGNDEWCRIILSLFNMFTIGALGTLRAHLTQPFITSGSDQ